MMRPDWEGKAESLFRWLTTGRGAPYTLEIHPTFKCNLHCIFCHQERERQTEFVDYSRELDSAQWLRIIDKAAREGVREVRICGGGEPMYDLSFSLELFRRIKAHGMIGYLTTNGTMFSEEACRLVVDLGWDKIEFSVDGASAGSHETLRRMPGCFSRTVNAITRICALRDQLGAEIPFVIINFVVNNRNYTEIPDLVRLFGPIGVDQILLLGLHPGGEAGDSLVIPEGDKQALWDTIREAKQLATQQGMKISEDIVWAEEHIDKSGSALSTNVHSDATATRHPSATTLSAAEEKAVRLLRSPCYEPWYYLQIIHDGYYSPCCNSYVDKSTESLHTESMETLWREGSHICKVRGDLLAGKVVGGCEKCDAVNVIKTQKIRGHLLRLCGETGLLSREAIEHIRADAHILLPGDEPDV